MRYTFQDTLTPRGHPAGSENEEEEEEARQKKQRRAAAAVMGYLQRLFTWIEPEKKSQAAGH